MRVILFSIMTSALLLISCAYPTPHENFKSHMNFNVGKSINDPDSHLTRYSYRVVGSKLLPNGNVEKEFLLNEICRVFFEVDKSTEIITQWRFEGGASNCKITP